jgi:hypothetical protein
MPSKQLEGVVFDGHSIDATSRTTTEELKPVNNIASLIRPNRVREFFDSTSVAWGCSASKRRRWAHMKKPHPLVRDGVARLIY